MIQSYKNIYQQIQIIKGQGLNGHQVQKIYSSATLICLQCRLPGRTLFLYLGRGSGVEGLWYGDSTIESKLRKRDQLLEYLRKFLTSSRLIDISMDKEDRIIHFDYGKYGKVNRLSLFYKSRDLYFSNRFFDLKQEKFLLYKSWQNTKDESLSSDNCPFAEIGTSTLDRTLEKELTSVESLLEKERKLLVKNKSKKVKKIERKLSNIKNDLEVMYNSDKLYTLANTEEDFSRFPKKIKLCTVKFNFEFNDHFRRRDQIFTKAKKLKSKIKFMEDRYKTTSLELKKFIDNETYSNNLTPNRPVFKVEEKGKISNSQETMAKEYEVRTVDGISIGVGLTAAGNDKMRIEWGKKDDYWFHAHGQSSKHVIVKTTLSKLLSTMKNIEQIFFESMDANISEIQLIYTQLKNIKGVKGKQGSVTYKKIKHIKAYR